jgi:hypothetical protein
VRVALDSSVRTLGGVSRHLIELASGLLARGLDIHLSLSADAGEVISFAEQHAIPVTVHGVDREVDIVHFHLANTFDRSATMRMVRRRGRGTRLVATEHLPHSNASDPMLPLGGTSTAKTAAKTVLKRAQLGLCDVTIVLSTGCLAFMTSRYRCSPDRLIVVHNGIPVPATPLPPSKEGAGVLALGSLSVQKGFDVLTRAAALGSWVDRRGARGGPVPGVARAPRVGPCRPDSLRGLVG